MDCYILTYNIRNEWHDYSDLYNTIKEEYPLNWHLTENSWILFSENGDDGKAIAAKLKDKFVFEDYHCDTFCVFKLDTSYDCDGMAAKSFWKFLKENMEKC